MFKVNTKDTRTTPMASLEAIVDACSCHFINKNYPAALANNFFSVPRKLKIRRAKKKRNRIKNVLHNRIDHEYICCDTDLVINGYF